jgi:photosystem II stability/assembly factor-like uncharacterized protein
VPDPVDSNIIYAGAYWGLLTRFDRRTGSVRNITVWPDYPGGRTGSDMKYRFQWTYPIAISPADPTAVYVGGNVVFKSTNQGQSWTPISPDLTRNDKKRESGGRLEDIYDTVFTIAPSPLAKNIIWAGSDDGLIHLTRDGGKLWSDVTPPAVQAWTRINVIEASPHDSATAYVAANRYQLDDFHPYIYRTHDSGKTWTLISRGIPEDTFVRVVRQDTVRPQLLYAGTETGVYVSFDDGDHWQSLQLNLPVVPVTDLTVKDSDLVISTQGRAFWVLDDVAALQQITPDMQSSPLHLFKPRPAQRAGRRGGFGAPGGAPEGVVVDYYLAKSPTQPVTLEFLGASGKTIKSFSSESKNEPEAAGRGGRFAPGGNRPLPAQAGMNRFVWDMRYPDALGLQEVRTYLFGGSLRGPEVAPGDYKVKITVGDQTATQTFTVKKDPRVPTTPAEYQKQLMLLLTVRDKLSATNEAINKLRRVQQQVTAALQRTGADASLADEGRKFNDELNLELNTLYEPRFTGFDDQTLIYPLKLNNRIAALQGYVGGDYGPTDQEEQVFAELSAELDQALAKIKQSLDTDLPRFNAKLKAAGIPAVTVSEAVAATPGID